MDAKERNRRGYQQRKSRKQQHTPVKGSAYEGDLGPAFNLLLERMEQMNREVRILAQTVEAMKEMDDHKRKEIGRRIVAEKQEGIQALKAAREEMVKLAEANPIDAQTRELYYQTALEEAEKHSEKKRERFSKYLRSCTTGTVNNYDGKAVRLTINGVSWTILPGQNKNVPKPFIELWNDRHEMNQYAMERMLEIAGMNDFGSLETWRRSERVDGLAY